MDSAILAICLSLLLASGCTDESTRIDADVAVDKGTVADDQGGSMTDAGPVDASWPIPQRMQCDGDYLSPEQGETPGYSTLIEVSGLVASLTRRDILWMHNDSGDEGVLYAIGRDGRRRGRLSILEQPVDWEDLATARCPDGRGACLWIGDIGDNRQERDIVEVIVVREPSQDGDFDAEKIWRYPVRYPDGPINSEALLVAADGRRFWLIEKVDGAEARVFEYPGPLNADQTTTLQTRTTMPSPGIAIERGRMITGADLHPSGQRVAIRTYTGSFEYILATPFDMSSLSTFTPRTIAFGPITEPQGEAIAYDEVGTGVWTISEDPMGSQVQPLHHYPCSD